MKRLLIICAITLSLGGCGTKLGNLVQVATTTITNPVDATDIYRVKNAYAAALEIAVEYRKYCWSKPYENIVGNAEKGIPADPVMKPVCERRRAVVIYAQRAGQKARVAIDVAQNFVADHPTLNAATAVSAAWAAVTDFKNSIPISK